MKRAIAGLLAVVTILCAAGRAQADSPSQVILKAGVYVESNAARNSNGVFAAGGDYLLHQGTKLEPFDASIYADLFGSSGGVGAAIRTSTPVYIGGGVGLYHVSLTPPLFCPVMPPGGGCKNTTFTASGAGAKLFGGFAVGGGAGLELAYHFTPNAGGYQTNFATAELTFRF